MVFGCLGFLNGGGPRPMEGEFVYKGPWVARIPNGKVQVRYSTGAVYNGIFENGLRSGEGEFIQADGTSYVGHWFHDLMHGTGTMKLSTMDIYAGDFREGRIHGKGVLTYASGNEYNGEFKDGKPNGRGVMRFQTGARFEGNWKDGQMRTGLKWYPDGSEYYGEFEDGRKHGQGALKKRNGELVYSGQWSSGIEDPDGSSSHDSPRQPIDKKKPAPARGPPPRQTIADTDDDYDDDDSDLRLERERKNNTSQPPGGSSNASDEDISQELLPPLPAAVPNSKKPELPKKVKAPSKLTSLKGQGRLGDAPPTPPSPAVWGDNTMTSVTDASVSSITITAEDMQGPNHTASGPKKRHNSNKHNPSSDGAPAPGKSFSEPFSTSVKKHSSKYLLNMSSSVHSNLEPAEDPLTSDEGDKPDLKNATTTSGMVSSTTELVPEEHRRLLMDEADISVDAAMKSQRGAASSTGTLLPGQTLDGLDGSDEVAIPIDET